jgi:outer membrane protein assembly factor BamB
LVAIFWIGDTLIGHLGETIFGRFLPRAISTLALLLIFSGWWLGTKRFTFRERLLCFLAAILGCVVACRLNRDTWQAFGLIFMGVPILFTAWAAWLFLSQRMSRSAQCVGVLIAQLAVWAGFCVTRPEGIDGQLATKYAWRWSETKEQTYLRKQPTRTTPAVSRIAKLELRHGDWPNFRGPSRDGIYAGPAVQTDWSQNPPRQVWRRPIGPAWSSMLVVGGYVFTQEQHGDDEAVVCLDAASGEEVWSHLEKVRFYDSQAGPGPRATPTFDSGNLHSVGGTGVVLCLDAASGEVRWKRDLVQDTKAPLPMWGFSSTPLAIDGVLVNYAGGPGGYGLIAYRLADGEPVWHQATGPISYSSPTPVVLAGKSQVLQLSDHGLLAVEPSTGKPLWNFEAKNDNIWRCAAPQTIGDKRLLFGSEDLGLVSLTVEDSPGEGVKAQQEWATSTLKPAYNDFVLVDGFVYGFNEGDFSCVDATTGKKKWRGGKFGHGQVVAVAEQHLLVVQAESGEVILVKASPEKLVELGSVSALHSKTWNHPALAQGKLFVRNDEEIVCYDLTDGESLANVVK